MSISTDLTRLQSAKAAMKTAMQNKGVTVPDGAKLDAFAALIDSIPAGGGSGNIASGTFTPADRLSSVTVEHGLGVAPSVIVVVPLPTGAVDKTNPIAFYIAKEDVGGISIFGVGGANSNYTSLGYKAYSASNIAGHWTLDASTSGSNRVQAVDAQKFVVTEGFGVRTILWFAEA